MTPIVVYAIRQKSTGYFMPASASRRHGYTGDEPTPDTKSAPRLFLRKSAAELALRAWLKGAWMQKYNYDPFGEVDSCGHEIVPVDGRDAADMEVVELVIAEPTTEAAP